MMETQSEPIIHDKPTRTVTFRINSHVLEKLQVHAKFEKSTVNALVNKLLFQAIEWNVIAAKSNWVPTERDVIKSVLDNLDDETIVQIAKREGKTLPKDLCLSMHGICGMDEWMNIIKLRSYVAGFDLTSMNDDKGSVYVMHHDMGKKYSLHSKSFYEQAFKEFECDAVFEDSENTLVFQISKQLSA